MWNDDFSAAFVQDSKNMFHFSPELLRRFNNLSCWRIDSSFIAAYPEFAGDIPTYNSVPRKIDDKSHHQQNEEYYFGSEQVDGDAYDGATTAAAAAAAGNGQWVYDHGRWYTAAGVR
jgi:hypothetical protein